MRTLVLLLALGVSLGAVAAFAAPAAEATSCVPDVGSCVTPVVCDLLFDGCGPCWPECPPP